MSTPSERADPFSLTAAAAEIEAHVGQAGWDLPPTLFALVRAERFASDDPEAAARMGLDTALPDALTPVEQEPLPDGQLDEVLAGIGWPDSVAGCALSHEILILPPGAEQALDDDEDGDSLAVIAAHPERREARLVVAVLRDGSAATVLRVRGDEDELLTGADLAPNLAAALLATLADD